MLIKISIPQNSLSKRTFLPTGLISRSIRVITNFLSRQHIRAEVYKPVVDEILQLVRGQIKQVMKEHNTTPKVSCSVCNLTTY